MKLNHYLRSYAKINSKWIKDLNIRGKPIQLLEENIGVSLCGLVFGNGFLAVTPKAQTTKEKTDKLNAVVWMFVSPPPHPYSYVEILMPKVMILGGGTSGRL